jgi:hypothetical protein
VAAAEHGLKASDRLVKTQGVMMVMVRTKSREPSLRTVNITKSYSPQVALILFSESTGNECTYQYVIMSKDKSGGGCRK